MRGNSIDSPKTSNGMSGKFFHLCYLIYKYLKISVQYFVSCLRNSLAVNFGRKNRLIMCNICSVVVGVCNGHFCSFFHYVHDLFILKR
jgi:hypothetical protein